MSDSPGPWRYRVLGGLAVEDAHGRAPDLGGRKQRAVLASLLLDLGRAVPVDRLVDQVWGEDPPARADASLQAYVSKLRRLLEPDRPNGTGHVVLVTEAGGYRLTAGRDTLDLTRFDDLRLRATAAHAAGDHVGAARIYDDALALHGPLLPELAGESWVADAAARIEATFADVLDGAFEAKLALGGGRELVGDLEAAVASHPFRERLRGHLALALYRAGRQTDALRALGEARRTLAEEIGVDPGPDLRRLEADILAQAPHLDAHAAGAGPAATRLAAPTGPPAARPPVIDLRMAADGPAILQRPEGSTAGDVPTTSSLIGRAIQLGHLTAALGRAAAGSGGAIVVSGEPGIGKTRLAEELVAAATGEGFLVAWARCHESAASAPYWGYTQIAEQLLDADVISDSARDGISAAGGGVHTIDPAADRATLHGSMVAALRSTTQPLLLVVDDLQWADASSLRALEFVAGTLATVPVLLVATVRPVGPDAPAPLVACLGELARVPGSRRIDLAGLTAADVRTWLERRGGAVTDDVAGFVHDRTGGNPFFVGEVVELLAGQDRLGDLAAARAAAVPRAAVDVVRRRVGMLPPTTQPLLAAASVLGVTVELDLLAQMTGSTVPDVLDALDAAVEAGLLVEDAVGPARLQFAHALVADALAAELSFARRARLHARAMTAIESLRAARLDDELATLVHHGRAGAAAGVAPQAFGHATRAARVAHERGAYEVAAEYWSTALELLDLARPGDVRGRVDVLVELGQARRLADDLVPAQKALLEAIGLAEQLGDAPTVRRAAGALATASLWQTSPYGLVDAALVDGLERALAVSGDAPPGERAVLLGALADAVYYDPDPRRSGELSAEGVRSARESGDAEVLVLSLSQRFRALWRGWLLGEQDEIAAELAELVADPAVGPGLSAVGHLVVAVVAMSHGDGPAFETHLAAARAAAERSQMPGLVSQVGFAEVFWLAARGRFDEALAHAHHTDRIYRRARGWQADDILSAFATSIAVDQGTLDEHAVEARALLDGGFGDAAREGVAWMLAEDGRLDEARALVGPPGTVPDPPADWLWLEALSSAGHVRATLGDTVAGEEIYGRLLPFAGRADVTGGPFLGGIDLVLARLSDLLGDRDAALRHAAAAVDLLQRLDTPPTLARALAVQGSLLAHSDDPDERARGTAALDRARRIATDLGVVPVLRALDGIQAGSKVATS